MKTKLQFLYGQYPHEQALALATDGMVVFSGVTKQVYVDGQAYGGNAADILRMIGDLDNLKTTNKDSLVAAINEVFDDVYDRALGMRYNGPTADGTLSLNSETNDIRPGDMYTATGSFTIGTTTVEPGDMVIYNGAKSEVAVTATAENSVILERETDDMVTAVNDLTANLFVFGESAKGIKTTYGSNDLAISLLQEETAGTSTITSESTDAQIPTAKNVYDAVRSLSLNVVSGDYESAQNPGTFSKTTETVVGGLRQTLVANVIGTFKTGEADVHDPQSPNYVNGLATVEDVQNYIEERFTWKEYETMTASQLNTQISEMQPGQTLNLTSNITSSTPIVVG